MTRQAAKEWNWWYYTNHHIKNCDEAGGQAGFKHGTGGLKSYSYTDIKENQIFLIYKEIQSGAVANSYMRTGFLIYEEMRKYFPIYEEADSHVWLCNCSILNFLIYEENLIFLFISVIAEFWGHSPQLGLKPALHTSKALVERHLNGSQRILGN